MKVRSNGIDIEVEDSATSAGPDHLRRPVVLLIMGLGMQLVAWPPQMVEALQDAGYRVVRFDNRDVGLSTHMNALGKPNMLLNMLKFQMGFIPSPPYTLTDMANDSLGVLDALGIEKAHVVGVSMGGMIAQRLAIAAPKRVQSLTSIMSTSGARALPKPDPQVLKILMSRPKGGQGEEGLLQYYFRLFKAIGSPAFVTPEADMRERILAGVRRSYDPVGVMRQMLAVITDITRAAQLSRITSPTLVIHGKADPLVPYAGGEDTARRIAGARMVGIDGMGHDLPPGVVTLILQHLLVHLQASRTGQAQPTDPDNAAKANA